MDRTSAFISYSSHDKVIGGRFKSSIESYCGYEVFIAHDDIPASSIWEVEIIKSLNKTDIFIPLISEAFMSSPFTDQETGIAVCLGKKIIPIKLESTNPYGFISKYQALQYKQNPENYSHRDNVSRLAISIAQIGMNYDFNNSLHQKATNSIVYAFCNSGSFYTSNAVISSMIKCRYFSKSQISLIAEAIRSNIQIREAYDLPVLIKFLFETYKIKVD